MTRRILGYLWVLSDVYVHNDNSYFVEMNGQYAKLHLGLLLSFTLVLIWSGINPHDRFTWWLEVIPAILGSGILVVIYPKFRLTNLLYSLIALHGIVLMVGGHYTYAEVPLFHWIKEILGQSRNNYDKVGHFMQGFVPAMIMRELFVRYNVISKKSWRNFLIVFSTLGISAVYELLEWWVAEFSGEGADAFLGTQGYTWDTQSDMFLAGVGAVSALVLLSKWHDRQLVSIRD